MRRNILRYLAAIIVTVIGWSCTDEEVIQQKGTASHEEVWVSLDFGHKDFDPMTVTTRSTLGEVAESRVQDLYLYLFDATGNCVYNQYFGSDTQKQSEAEMNAATTEQCWYVQNRTSETNAENSNHDTTEDTHGSIRLRAPEFTNGTLYLIANANAHVVNISPDKLSTIQNESDLLELTATLQGDVVTRYGYFPMVEVLTGISVDKDGIKQTGSNSVTAHLERLDAKINVNVMAATGHEYNYGGSTQTVKDFTPESWSVIHVPKGAFVIEQEGKNDGAKGYFDYLDRGFETATATTYETTNESHSTTRHGFSFYMLENRYTATNEINGFDQRDLAAKNATGEYVYENGQIKWANAPQASTYLVIKGYLSMDVTDTDNSVQELGADVTYYIHLGNFSAGDYTNFQVERNTHHTYNITIKGVKNIEVEVQTSDPEHPESLDEKQPGATGNIFVSQQSSQLFDAHYAQYVTSLDADNLDIQDMAWYVQTPFGSIGSPQLSEATHPGDANYNSKLKNYDYKWVWFMINPKADNSNSCPQTPNGTYELPDIGTGYSTTNQWYPGDDAKTKTIGDARRLMNVDEFVSYIKEQKIIYDADQADNNAIDGSATVDGQTRSHIFRNMGGKYSVYFTVFIDEYYYESHPIEGEASPTDLWKQFVNGSNRLMHILCNSSKSLDGESSSTNSVITIRQRPIQTPYNLTKESLETAWGCEIVDEGGENLNFYPTGGKPTSTAGITNLSQDNGLYNTVCLWAMFDNDTFSTTEQWATYVDPNGDYGMTTNKQSLLYSPLVRNRDNNGNGKIDADEVHWYIASLGQLYGLFMGQLGLKADAYLYPLERVNQTDYPLHITSSTSNEQNSNPVYLWAEEALSTATGVTNSIRCVRNLGMEKGNIVGVPESLVRVIKPEGTITENSMVRFDLSNINEKSLRILPATVELDAGDEFSDMSRLYYGFETGETIPCGTGAEDYITLIKERLDSGYQFASDGWRVPNIREAALMSLYCSSTETDTRDWNNIWWKTNYYTRVSTYWSLGYYGNQKDNNNRSSWKFTHRFGTVGNPSGIQGYYIRLVRDVHPSDF